MYLWKYWRESRITFAVGLVLVGLLLWAVLKIPVGSLVGDNHRSENVSAIYLVVAAILTVPLGFLALKFGSFGVGRDLGAGSGSFVFSRPRPHAFFVWSDWSYGMAQLLLIVIAANLVLALAVHRAAPASGPILVAGVPVSFLTIFCLHCVAGLLLTGLLFGLTYFASVLAKGHGVLLAIGVIVVYTIAKAVVKYKWQITLPDVTLTEFSVNPEGALGFAKNLGVDIAARSALTLAFPLAAQILLQQRDVD
jgi:hypothetical protein